MSIRVPSLAFCNDCDLMSWSGYQDVHRVLDSLGLPAGDSFWLFDPSGGDFGLFKQDLSQKGPRHDELLEEIRSGKLDVLHSAGSYGARFNNGFRPTRRLIADALEYLQKHAVVPRIWSNHGDDQNIQNIGGREPLYYHGGDDPSSDVYILDLLLDAGIEYFWLDRLLISDARAAYRLVAEEICRPGQSIRTFMRYHGLVSTPNATNFGEQLSANFLSDVVRVGQSSVIYQHWGCRHREDGWAYTANTLPTLSTASMEGLERLAEKHRNGEIQVKRLGQLLDEERGRSLNDEAQRIGSVVVLGEKEKFDDFYFNQYNKHSIGYFEKRVAKLGLHGKRALDAGCGVGQWSFALLNHFEEVHGIDYSDTAVECLEKISEGLRVGMPRFIKGSVESLPYPEGYFDYVHSYGVIFCAHVDVVLNEVHRVLTPKGSAYICLNADGWYEYLVDIRFKNHDESMRRGCVAPIWNAIFARLGGRDAFAALTRDDALMKQVIHSAVDGSYELERCVLSDVSNMIVPGFSSTYLDSYSDDVIRFLSQFYVVALLSLSAQWEQMLGSSRNLFPNKSKRYFDVFIKWFGGRSGKYARPTLVSESSLRKYMDIVRFLRLEESSQNRAYLPSEFHELALKCGFKEFVWASDSELNFSGEGDDVSPIYQANYRGRPAVWECFITKDASGNG